MSQIKLPQNMVQYFSLFLVEKDEESDFAGTHLKQITYITFFTPQLM